MRGKKISLWRGIAIGGLILLTLWLVASIWNIGQKAQIAWQTAHEAKSQYADLETRKATLQADIAALNTPRGQDAAIREAYGVARPGEEVIVLVPPATTTATTTPSWWQQVLDWF